MRLLQRRLGVLLLALLTSIGMGMLVAQPAHAVGNDGFFLNVAYGECMDLAYGDARDGTPIGKYPCVDGANRLWRLEFVGDRPVCFGAAPVARRYGGSCYDLRSTTVFRIRSALTGKCVDINNKGISSGETIHEWTCLNDLSQMWYVDAGTTNGSTVLASAWVQDQVQIERVIDAAPQYQLRIWTRNYSLAQDWLLP